MAVMRGLASNIGGSPAQPPLRKDRVKRILVSRPNGRLGNLLLITPMLQEIEATFPDAKVDLFVKGELATVLFGKYPNVDRIIRLPKKPFSNLLRYAWAWLSLKRHRYDLVVNAVNYSSSGRLSTKFASSRHKFFGDMDGASQSKYINYKHIAKAPVYNLRSYLKSVGLPENNNRIAPPDLRLTADEIAEGQTELASLVGNDKKTICLFTYATGRKCYPPEWWTPFYERLLASYPDYNIVEVLPIENVSQIGFRAPSFYSSDIRRIGALIANTEAFIGADSGIMHLASASGAPVVGLFSASNSNVYRPYNKNSIAVNTESIDTNALLGIIDRVLAGKVVKLPSKSTVTGKESNSPFSASSSSFR